MKIIEQSYQILQEKDQLKLIELAGRTCYKSENKITKNSAKKFVRQLVLAKHFAMIEFGRACFSVSRRSYDFLRHARNSAHFKFSPPRIVSGNFRAWYELILDQPIAFKSTESLRRIATYLKNNYPDIFSDIVKNIPQDEVAEPLDSRSLPSKERETHAVETVRFVTNRGVSHELVRHRLCSFAQESTRFVRYGDKEMEFIKPVWWKDTTFLSRALFGDIATQSEAHYLNLLNQGWKPEQAREVLPNSLKTEIVVQATLSEWKHIFSLRCHRAAHPQMRALMKPVEDKMFAQDETYTWTIFNYTK